MWPGWIAAFVPVPSVRYLEAAGHRARAPTEARAMRSGVMLDDILWQADLRACSGIALRRLYQWVISICLALCGALCWTSAQQTLRWRHNRIVLNSCNRAHCVAAALTRIAPDHRNLMTGGFCTTPY